MRRPRWLGPGVLGVVACSLALPLASARAAEIPASPPASAPAASPALPAVPSPALPASPAVSPASPASLASKRGSDRGAVREPAPRPTAAVRVQPRFAEKAQHIEVLVGFEYFARGDFFTSPGARAGVAYYPIEALGLEALGSHYWSSLDGDGQRIRDMLGALPDSHAPGWLMLAGARYSIGYGKVLVSGLGAAIHFEPQVFVHGGVHDHSGDVGPSADVGLGFLVFLTPRVFARIDAALVFERETRSGNDVSVWGALPAFSMGGIL